MIPYVCTGFLRQHMLSLKTRFTTTLTQKRYFLIISKVIIVKIIYEAFFQSVTPSCTSSELFGKEDVF